MIRYAETATALFIIFTLAVTSVSCTGMPETAELTIGPHRLTVEIADNEEKRAKGLMNRDSLPPDYGMLFVYDRDLTMRFWMKNTRIPLSIAFISKDGVIKEIYDMEPYSLMSIESMHSVRYALEVPRGYFRERGISVGDSVKIPASAVRGAG